MQYYKVDTNPLKEVSFEESLSGDFIYDSYGACYKKVVVNGKAFPVQIHAPVLNEGEYINELTPLQLLLFWSISKNERKRFEL